MCVDPYGGTSTSTHTHTHTHTHTTFVSEPYCVSIRMHKASNRSSCRGIVDWVVVIVTSVNSSGDYRIWHSAKQNTESGLMRKTGPFLVSSQPFGRSETMGDWLVTRSNALFGYKGPTGSSSLECGHMACFSLL